MKKIIINKGCHYTWSILPKILLFCKKNKEIKHTFMFTDSCLYDDINEQVNKLWGFSVGLFTSPRVESFRFGWNCQKKNGKIQIFDYVEKDYKFTDIYICDVEINKWYSYIILKTDNSIIMKIFDDNIEVEEITHDFLNDINWVFGKTCRPYFGGELTAPHKIIIMTK